VRGDDSHPTFPKCYRPAGPEGTPAFLGSQQEDLTGRKEATLRCCCLHGSSDAVGQHVGASWDGRLDNGLPRGYSECGGSPVSCVQCRGSMGCPFSSLWWYSWQNNLLLSGASQKPDEGEYDEDEEGFGGHQRENPSLLLRWHFDYLSCLLCSSKILLNSVFSADTCWPSAEGYCVPRTKISCLKGFRNLGSHYYL